jgi:two-component system C4-dicarboxylate transport sensor histidine kinase DctB
MLREIMDAVRKSSGLISSLTDIARRERPDVRVVSPSKVMESVLDLRRYDLKVARVELETNWDDDMADISVDIPKLEQSLIYVFSNAIEALENCEDKRMKLSVQSHNGCVEFLVWNSGEPIAEADRTQIFEPFFTTKEGDHLGLGLWVARKNLRERNGDLEYDAERGFRAVVPREAETAQAPAGN